MAWNGPDRLCCPAGEVRQEGRGQGGGEEAGWRGGHWRFWNRGCWALSRENPCFILTLLKHPCLGKAAPTSPCQAARSCIFHTGLVSGGCQFRAPQLTAPGREKG